MSKRYEVDNATTHLEIITPDDDPDTHGLELDDGRYALMIGNPWSSAFAIAGSPEDIREFSRRVSELVERSLPAPEGEAQLSG